jgi:4-amino-4-deoxy-L-arabinose transferase-like glycosyltransferase
VLERVGRFNAWLIAIAGTGVLLRLVYVYVLTPGTHGIGDWYFFHWQANLIADGHGFIEPFRWRFLHRSLPTAAHPPLWPLLLSGASELGWAGAHAHRAAGCVLGGGTIVALGFLGRRVGGERVGLVAAAIAALYPSMIATDGSLMSESLYALLVALTLLAAYRLYDRPSPASGLLFGAAIGLASLARSEALLFLPLIALPLAWRAPSKLRTFALACAATAIVISPWMIRTWSVFGQPVLISTNGPAVLKGANCPRTYHGRDVGYWRLDCVIGPKSDNEAKNGVRWTKESLGYERDHPGDMPRVLAARLLRTWNFFQPRQMVYYAEGQDPDAVRAGLVVYYALLGLGAYGLILLRRWRQPLVILLGPIIAVSFVSLFYFGLQRFRVPADLSLVVLSAVALVALAERIALRVLRGRGLPSARAPSR